MTTFKNDPTTSPNSAQTQISRANKVADLPRGGEVARDVEYAGGRISSKRSLPRLMLDSPKGWTLRCSSSTRWLRHIENTLHSSIHTFNRVLTTRGNFAEINGSCVGA